MNFVSKFQINTTSNNRVIEIQNPVRNITILFSLDIKTD